MDASRHAGDGTAPAAGGDRSDPPNVVVVVMDTARARDTVPADPAVQPALASIASAGTEFTRAFTSAPWTLPSHASLFTGAYTAGHGVHGDQPYLDPAHPTLPEAFAAAGYETVGVSNNCWITGEFGFDRGFERFRKGWQYVQSDIDTGAVVRAEGLEDRLAALWARLFEGNPAVTLANVAYESVVCPDEGAERTTTEVERWLAGRDRRDPFFLFCNYIEPHAEYDPPGEFARRYLPDDRLAEARAIRQDPRAFDVGEYSLTDEECELLRGLYRAELAYVDSHLARLREALRAAGEWEDTLFVVLGDHGENIGDHGFFGHQYNLRETVLHVPLVVHGGAFTGGGRRGDLVQLLDLVPTLLEATGVEAPALANRAQGWSYHPDADGARTAVFAEHVAPRPPVSTLAERFDDLPERVRTFDRTRRSVRTTDAKYVRDDEGAERLRVLDGDADGRDRDALRQALAARLDGWFEEVDREGTARSGAVEMSASTQDRLADLGYL